MKVKVQVNNKHLANIVGADAKGIVLVECDKHGVPLVKEWRNRFADAEVDNCITILSDKKATKQKTEVSDATS